MSNTLVMKWKYACTLQSQTVSCSYFRFREFTAEVKHVSETPCIHPIIKYNSVSFGLLSRNEVAQTHWKCEIFSRTISTVLPCLSNLFVSRLDSVSRANTELWNLKITRTSFVYALISVFLFFLDCMQLWTCKRVQINWHKNEAIILVLCAACPRPTFLHCSQLAKKKKKKNAKNVFCLTPRWIFAISKLNPWKQRLKTEIFWGLGIIPVFVPILS